MSLLRPPRSLVVESIRGDGLRPRSRPRRSPSLAVCAAVALLPGALVGQVAREAGAPRPGVALAEDLRLEPIEVEFDTDTGDGTLARTRLRYRIVGSPEGDLVERLAEAQTLDVGRIPARSRERTRLYSLASAASLAPLRSELVIHRWQADSVAWATEKWSYEFEPGAVRIIRRTSARPPDTTLVELPRGVLQREMAPLAFAFASSTPRATTEMVAWDVFRDSVVDVRFEPIGIDTVAVLGREVEAWKVRVWSGEEWEGSYYRAEPPRVFIGEWGGGGSPARITRLRIGGRAGKDASGGGVR